MTNTEYSATITVDSHWPTGEPREYRLELKRNGREILNETGPFFDLVDRLAITSNWKAADRPTDYLTL